MARVAKKIEYKVTVHRSECSPEERIRRDKQIHDALLWAKKRAAENRAKQEAETITN